MNDELAKRYEGAIAETLGHCGRMISLSKSGYHRLFPERFPVFNANVCLRAGKVWHGDLDLTLDERRLQRLARKVGQTVFVLSEFDGRFNNEGEPLLEQAVFSVTSCGHSRFETSRIERSADGRLRRRPLERRMYRRLVLPLGRPRLWRFWQIEKTSKAHEFGEGRERFFELRFGGRGPDPREPWRRASPALALIVIRRNGEDGRSCRLELIWYPGQGFRLAPMPLYSFLLELKHGPLRPYLSLSAHQGVAYHLAIGFSTYRRHAR